MISSEEFAEIFIKRMEAAPTLDELDKVAAEIKEAVELLRCYYTSNKLKFTAPGKPEDILKKGAHNAKIPL